MSSAGSAPPLRLELRPSRGLAGFLLATHVGAAAAVLASGLPSWAAAAGGIALAASLLHHLRRYALLTAPGAVVALLARSDGAWDLRLRSGATHTAEPLPGPLVHPHLVVLRLAGPSRTRVVPIAGDMLDRDAHRRLRVRLTLSR
jgi:toxin CptA